MDNHNGMGADPLQGHIDPSKRFFSSGVTRGLAFRKEQLLALARGIERRESEILDALWKDLKKSPTEAYTSEVGFVLSDIHYALRKLAGWIRPLKRRPALFTWPSQAMVCPEPYGVVLIIGPWNYPFQLILSPLVGAVAAGNCACLKPSEFAPATSKVVRCLVRDTFPSDYISLVEGGPETTQALINDGFDKVFFTGSAGVGRQIMKQAADHLTPVTLELGGKNPCFVCPEVDPVAAARRIVWGKFMNAGQTCVAPDHVLVDEQIAEDLIQALESTVVDFYGAEPKASPDYGRIVNHRHWDRLVSYLKEGRIICGGQHDREDLFLAPTLLTGMPPSAAVMQEEIFGPILPIVSFRNLGEEIQKLQLRPKPLALYVFSEDRSIQARIVNGTSSGGVCINDTMSQIFGKSLPFGGVGASGMGCYHGKDSFACFTHYKSVLRRRMRPDLRFRYPPARHPLAQLKRVYGLLLRW